MTDAKDWITAQPPADGPHPETGDTDHQEEAIRQARAALAAMRPVSVDAQKLAEIRALIEAGLAGALPYQDESGVVRIKLHPFGKLRRAQEMLSALEVVSHDD